MTQETSDQARKLSSRNGRYWLRESRSESIQSDAVAASSGLRLDAGESLPFRSVAASGSSKATLHESVVVSIPNVAAASRAATATKIAADSARNSSSSRVVAPLPAVPSPHVTQPQTVAQPVAAEPVATPQVPVASPSSAPAPNIKFGEVKTATSNNQTPEVQTTSQTQTKTDDAVDAARAGQTDETKDAISKIADEIIKRHPTASPSVIMFAGSQVSLHTDESCARVAAELASRQLGQVLLVDSDFSSRRLTKASGMSAQGGLSEVMNIAFPWEDAILKSGSSKLDFMPAGNCPHKRWTPKEQLRSALAEMRQQYQFICVSVGDAHDTAADTWADLSDGAFLLVSVKGSSDAIAKSAVLSLRSSGARLDGCVVADVDTRAA